MTIKNTERAHINAQNPAPSLELQRTVDFILKGVVLGKKHLATEPFCRHAYTLAIFLILRNDWQRRGTSLRDVMSLSGQSPGAVRAAFDRLRESGYAEVQQRVGRSALFRPTPLLVERMEHWMAELNGSP